MSPLLIPLVADNKAINWLIGALAALCVLGATHTAAYYIGHARGAAEEQQKTAAKEVARAQTVASAVVARAQEIRHRETVTASQMASIVLTLEKKKAENAKDPIFDQLRTGAVRLRIQPASSTDQSLPGAARPGSGTDGTCTGDIPATTAGHLYDLAAEADNTAERLGACQRALIVQQQTCNGS